MNTFLKALVIILVAVILSASLPKSAKDFSVVMTIGVCSCLVIVICYFIEPIISTFRSFAEIGGIDDSLLEVLLKSTGVAILSEYVTLICNDSGNATMGKGAQLLGTIVVLWLSLPLFTSLMDIIKNIFIST